MQKQAQLLMPAYFLLLVFGLAAQTLKPVPAGVLPAQHARMSFAGVHLFQKTGVTDSAAARFAEDGQFLHLKNAHLRRLLAARHTAISLVLPYNGAELVVDLVRTDIGVPENYPFENASLECSHRLREVQIPGIHYRGKLRGSPGALAAFSFFEDEVWGIVSDAQHYNLVLGKLQRPGNTNAYLLYSDKNLAMDNPFECAVREIPAHPSSLGSNPPVSLSNQTIRVALEADHSLVMRCGTERRASQYLAALFNQVATFYANERIDLRLEHLAVPEGSLYVTGAGAESVLEQFRKSCVGFGHPDLAHLVGTVQVLRESAGYQDGLCAQEYAASLSAIEPSFMHVPTFSWATAILAHEIGHQLGARHTQWCGWPEVHVAGLAQSAKKGNSGRMTLSGTLMGYCSKADDPVLLQAGLGEAPGNMVRRRVTQALSLRAAEAETRSAGRYVVSKGIWSASE